MKFTDVYKEMKERRLLRGAKKENLKAAYELHKSINDIKKECEKQIDEVMEQVKKTDCYTLNGAAYCSMLEILYDNDLM